MCQGKGKMFIMFGGAAESTYVPSWIYICKKQPVWNLFKAWANKYIITQTVKRKVNGMWKSTEYGPTWGRNRGTLPHSTCLSYIQQAAQVPFQEQQIQDSVVEGLPDFWSHSQHPPYQPIWAQNCCLINQPSHFLAAKGEKVSSSDLSTRQSNITMEYEFSYPPLLHSLLKHDMYVNIHLVVKCEEFVFIPVTAFQPEL